MHHNSYGCTIEVEMSLKFTRESTTPQPRDQNQATQTLQGMHLKEELVKMVSIKFIKFLVWKISEAIYTVS